ncbi:pyruvate carboxylase [Bacillus subtilis]|nr:pyruvate carboxylase [Bacillus subtilis]
MLTYIGNVTVNGFPGIGKKEKPAFDKPLGVKVDVDQQPARGTKQILDEKGAEGLANWVKEQKSVLLTDTTFRDAHQSLLATRIRSHDLKKIANPTAALWPELFSMEMWGGATFDVAYRFLKEDPWKRLEDLRKEVPNTLFQMLLRSSNAVGYTNYPDNVIKEFVKQSAQSGIDVFRIFDSLNWVKGMTLAIDAVRDTGKVAEAAICYTGDILDKNRTKYDLAYYTSMAKELEAAGAHILGIKDMAGLLKPQAAYELVSALKETIDIPVHLHTHDTSGNGIYMYAKAVEAGVDIIDVAVSSMAGLTSQPSASGFYHAMEGNDRRPEMNVQGVELLSQYWESVRKYYSEFESGMKSPHTEIYEHEMPGGQYSNLQQQAKGVGLGDRWNEVKEMYRRVNDMFGDIVKVTPSSKVVGDMALYMVQNNLTEKDVYEKGESLDFPDSVVELFKGNIGQPHGGFPEKLQKLILKGQEPITVRPGELLEPVSFEAIKQEFKEQHNLEISDQDAVAYALYPKVFTDYVKTTESYGDISVLDTPTFFYGMTLGEEIEVEIERGKTLIVKLISIGEPQPDATRVVYFELNGQPREVVIKDESIKSSVQERLKADRTNPSHIAASMPGTVIKVLAEAGTKVNKGDHLMINEAMKMETTVQAPFSGTIKQVHVKNGEPIQTGDLLLEIEKA